MKKLVLALFIVIAPALHGQDSKLSDVEQLRLDLHRTQIAYEQALSDGSACRAQLRSVQLSGDQAALKADIEKAHPGYSVDLASGRLAKKAEK